MSAVSKLSEPIELDSRQMEEALQSDRHLWLENSDDVKVQEFVRTETAKTMDFESDDRIAHVRKHGELYYNLWKDAKNPKGLLRRTTWEEYLKPEPKWEKVLDVDALGIAESKGWEIVKLTYLDPEGSRVLIRLNGTGEDRCHIREMDLRTKTFIPDGFNIEEEVLAVGSQIVWADKDNLLLATSMNTTDTGEQGYPVIVRRWTRGSDPAEAPIIFGGEKADLLAGTIRLRSGPDNKEDLVHVAGIVMTSGPITHWVGLEWSDFRSQGKWNPNLRTCFVRDSEVWTRDYLYFTILDDVKQIVKKIGLAGGPAIAEDLRVHEEFDSVVLSALDADISNELFVIRDSFLVPATLLHGCPESPFQIIKSRKSVFDNRGLSVTQHLTTSKDGTRVAYFEVGPAARNKPGPTIIEAYGGHGRCLLPAYALQEGPAWLEKGYTHIYANVRNGGEYGTWWKEAAQRTKQFKRFEDMAAIVGDLVGRGITTTSQLGCSGASNGGFLMGNMLSRYPHLFGAVHAEVGVLDLARLPEYPRGASWTAEYGDARHEWELIQGHSPYHAVRSNVQYPPALLTTRSGDDRVVPAHTRRLFARLQDLGSVVYLLESSTGGHYRSSCSTEQWAEITASIYTFFEIMLAQ